MARPSEIVREHCRNPLNSGELRSPHAVGTADRGGSAPRIRIELGVNQSTIREFGFTTFGCGYMVAAGSVLSTLVLENSIERASAISADELAASMGGVPAHKMHCIQIAISGLQAALGSLDSDEEEKG